MTVWNSISAETAKDLVAAGLTPELTVNLVTEALNEDLAGGAEVES